MGDNTDNTGGKPTVVESHQRWVAGKTEEQLIADLKTHLALLRDNPRSLPDRLRVAAIQLRLGRIDEALIHYEGVVGGYVAEGQMMSAVTLCQRLLQAYPDLKRIQLLLAKLYARAPHKAHLTPAAAEPIEAPIKETPSSTFSLNELDLLGKPSRDEHGTDRFEVVERLFPESEVGVAQERRATLFDTRELEAVTDGPPPDDPEDKTTEKYQLSEQFVSLDRPKGSVPGKRLVDLDDEDPDTEQEVLPEELVDLDGDDDTLDEDDPDTEQDTGEDTQRVELKNLMIVDDDEQEHSLEPAMGAQPPKAEEAAKVEAVVEDISSPDTQPDVVLLTRKKTDGGQGVT